MGLHRRKRMTAHECLMHKWLAGDAAAARTATIESRRYYNLRDRLRQRYDVSIVFFLWYSNKNSHNGPTASTVKPG